MDKQEVIGKIDKVLSKIDRERNEDASNPKTTVSWKEGFDCGTQLGIDLLEEWKGELVKCKKH